MCQRYTRTIQQCQRVGWVEHRETHRPSQWWVSLRSTHPTSSFRGPPILPDGQISEWSVQPRFQNIQPCLKKYIACAVGQITNINSAVSCPQRGALANVTNVGHGMRWTRQRQVCMAIAGRVSRERSSGVLTNGAVAYGKIVLFWHPDAGVKFAEASRPDRV